VQFGARGPKFWLSAAELALKLKSETAYQRVVKRDKEISKGLHEVTVVNPGSHPHVVSVGDLGPCKVDGGGCDGDAVQENQQLE
jgi:hypothetical protein